MNFKKTIEYHIDQIPDVVIQLGELLNRCQVMTFTGPLGAGKTTLVQSMFRAQGITEPIMSPTFTYVNSYKDPLGRTFYHFDLYRIDSAQNFLAQGFEEYLYAPQSWAFIEWPEVIAPLLTHEVCHVTIEYHPQGAEKRLLTIEYMNEKGEHERQ
jgi:tRNA threonylcarbamoyladenosine biosynthesis protein TsaE